MKHPKDRGFIAITFVLFIAGLLVFFIADDILHISLLSNTLIKTRSGFEEEYQLASCEEIKKIQLIHGQPREISINSFVCPN